MMMMMMMMMMMLDKILLILSLRSVAGLVIQATGRTEFEDGLRTGVLLEDCWCPWDGCTYPRINFKPLWGCGLVLGWVWLSEGPHFRPNSNLLGSAHRWY